MYSNAGRIQFKDRFSSCERKIRYSESWATIKAESNSLRDGKPWRAYSCRYCEYWHISHKIHNADI